MKEGYIVSLRPAQLSRDILSSSGYNDIFIPELNQPNIPFIHFKYDDEPSSGQTSSRRSRERETNPSIESIPLNSSLTPYYHHTDDETRLQIAEWRSEISSLRMQFSDLNKEEKRRIQVVKTFISRTLLGTMPSMSQLYKDVYLPTYTLPTKGEDFTPDHKIIRNQTAMTKYQKPFDALTTKEKNSITTATIYLIKKQASQNEINGIAKLLYNKPFQELSLKQKRDVNDIQQEIASYVLNKELESTKSNREEDSAEIWNSFMGNPSNSQKAEHKPGKNTKRDRADVINYREKFELDTNEE